MHGVRLIGRHQDYLPCRDLERRASNSDLGFPFEDVRHCVERRRVLAQ